MNVLPCFHDYLIITHQYLFIAKVTIITHVYKFQSAELAYVIIQ